MDTPCRAGTGSAVSADDVNGSYVCPFDGGAGGGVIGNYVLRGISTVSSFAVIPPPCVICRAEIVDDGIDEHEFLTWWGYCCASPYTTCAMFATGNN